MAERSRDELVTLRMPVGTFMEISRALEKWSGLSWWEIEITEDVEFTDVPPEWSDSISTSVDLRVALAKPKVETKGLPDD